jgi:antitoxin component YwqK of YwqJK toxin-antitoxin module
MKPDKLICLCITMAACCLGPWPAMAEKRVENDMNRDGINDQVVIYDNAGTIMRVEVDHDQDGFFEKHQLYDRGALVKILRDTDNDRKWDCIDFFDREKRFRQERYGPTGKLNQISLFDAQEQIQKIQKDSTGDGQFDTIFYFKNGTLASSTKDTSADGTANVRTFYENQLPSRQEIDDNGDGTLDRLLFFDSKGQIEKLMKEPFGKDKFQTTLYFTDGKIKTRHRDMNKDGREDDITRFQNDLPVEQKQDTNFDGSFDIRTRFVKGTVNSREKDTDFDGTPDFFADFDEQGRVIQTREDTSGNGHIDRIRHYRSGTLYRVEHDHDGDEFFETVSLMENDRIVKNLIDKNRDGKVDLKVFYENSQKTFLMRDTDFDGYFDTTQRYDDPEWTMIILQDINKDEKPDIRSFFKDSTLRRKEIDENLDGFMDVVEIFDENGDLATLEEHLQGKPWLTWYYEPGEILVRGEEDKNQDGAVDIWYLYENGRLTTVKEDTTLDGKPDLWETYDETRAIVKRERDLDYDGIPDFVEMIEQAENDS